MIDNSENMKPQILCYSSDKGFRRSETPLRSLNSNSPGHFRDVKPSLCEDSGFFDLSFQRNSSTPLSKSTVSPITPQSNTFKFGFVVPPPDLLLSSPHLLLSAPGWPSWTEIASTQALLGNDPNGLQGTVSRIRADLQRTVNLSMWQIQKRLSGEYCEDNVPGKRCHFECENEVSDDLSASTSSSQSRPINLRVVEKKIPIKQKSNKKYETRNSVKVRSLLINQANLSRPN